jgi:hypothetical protein
MFKILSKGEKGINSIKVDGDVVTMQHQTVHPKIAPRKTGQRIMLTWTFDFSKVSRAELIGLASRSLVITMRAPFKALDAPQPEDWDNKTFVVRDWLDYERRQPVDKVAKVRKIFEGLTKDEIEAMMLEPQDLQQ